jgi:hypothetical protein
MRIDLDLRITNDGSGLSGTGLPKLGIYLTFHVDGHRKYKHSIDGVLRTICQHSILHTVIN